MILPVLGVAFMLAFIISIVAFTTTIFVLTFIYIVIPLAIIALARGLWLKFNTKDETQKKNKEIVYYEYDDK